MGLCVVCDHPATHKLATLAGTDDLCGPCAHALYDWSKGHLLVIALKCPGQPQTTPQGR